jgi:proline racemase
MRSTIDRQFIAQITVTSMDGGRPAVNTRISGRGWLFVSQTLDVDPDDPYPLGYILTD